MFILNKKNEAYLQGKRSTPVISKDPSLKTNDMQEIIQQGTLIHGCVETIQIIQDEKKKRKIIIGYVFTPPNQEVAEGVFTTSDAKAVTFGDEVAVWYVDKDLHILL
jgi:hypothetical protein